MTLTAAPYPDFDGTQPCADPRIDPEIFFGSDAVAEALAVCQRCPFRQSCAAYAITHEVRGTWGGLTGPTRQAIQKAHGINPQRLELSDSGTRAEEVRRLASAGTPPRSIAEQTGIWLESVYRILGRTPA